MLVGCQSGSPSRYISPRVEGKVLNELTREPIHGVTVRRLDPDAVSANGEIPRGGQTMEQATGVRTRNDGSFALASERDLELFRRSSWYSVTINFEHAGYLSFATNYSSANAVTTASGEP